MKVDSYVKTAADEIQKAIEFVAVRGVLDPASAAIQFRAFFDKISRSNDIPDEPNIFSPLGGITAHDSEQDALIGQTTMRTGGTVKLGDLPQHWDYRIIDGGDGTYKHRHDQHIVDHVICHLKGYNLYEKIPGHKSLALKETVQGRDIILVAIMIATPKIQLGLKHIVLEEFK